MRSGQWKLHLSHGYPRPSPAGQGGQGGQPGPVEQKRIDLSLYDLENDPGETTDRAAEHPEIVQRLEAMLEKCRDDLGDSATKRQGRNVREPGKANLPPAATRAATQKVS